jgi:hypothetical protein
VTRFWRNYNLSIVLFAIFLVCWVIQTIAGWVEFSAEETQHGATMENWTSEYLQLFSFVTLTAYLIHRGSPESKDGDERLERKVDEIRRELEALQKR